MSGKKQNIIGVYKIENVVDGKVYIGASTDIKKRCYQHLFALRRGTHANKYLQQAYNEYGESNFVFTIITECAENELMQLEVDTLHQYGGYKSANTYNMVEAGMMFEGENNPNYGKLWSNEQRAKQSERMKQYLSDPTNHPMYGKHHTAESIEKNRQSHLGKTQSTESNLKRSLTLKAMNRKGPAHPMYGRHLSDEAKAKIGMASRGRKPSPETIEKLRIASTGKKHTPDTIMKLKKIRQQYIWKYDGFDFNSAADLAEYLHSNGYPNISRNTITNLYNKGFDKSKTYRDLFGKISRVPVDKAD